MSCKDAMAALVASIETGDTLPPDVRTHLKNCERCHGLLNATRQIESALAAEPPQAPGVDEAQLHDKLRQNGRRQFLRRGAIALSISILAAGLLGFTVAMLTGRMDLGEAMMVFGIVSALAAIPAAFFFVLIAVLHDRHGNRIHKRLKEGRMVFGVCLGLSEALGVPVQLLRIGFVLLAFVKGIGLWFYVMLAFAMPVHPDDRQNLLRFRVRRWWQGRAA